MSEPVPFEPGQVYNIGGRLYGKCGRCGSIVRIDKPIIGSLHFC